jgi:hypothetical protein
MEIVPYKAEHLCAINAQEGQRHIEAHVTDEHAKALEGRHSFTALFDGKPLACGGVVEHYQGRFEASDEMSPRTFRGVHGAVKRFLDALPARRVEAYVEHSFRNGHRWMRALGFEMEAPRLRKYWPDGRDATLYVRVR